MKTREPRHNVLITARMRDGVRWQDVTIHNLSSRGMLVRASGQRPEQASYIEVRRGDQAIVGRVVWASDQLFGVRTQDRIDMPALAAGKAPCPSNDDRPPGERRARPRIEDQAERSRNFARIAQGLIMIAGGAAGAVFVAIAAWDVLRQPFAMIESALVG